MALYFFYLFFVFCIFNQLNNYLTFFVPNYSLLITHYCISIPHLYLSLASICHSRVPICHSRVPICHSRVPICHSREVGNPSFVFFPLSFLPTLPHMSFPRTRESIFFSLSLVISLDFILQLQYNKFEVIL